MSIIVSFLKERLHVKFIEEENLYKLVPTDFNKLRIPKLFKESMNLSHKLAIRIKDLLHLAYAFMLSKTYDIRYFLTRDVENFEKIKDEVKKLLQIEVILVR